MSVFAVLKSDKETFRYSNDIFYDNQGGFKKNPCALKSSEVID